MTNISVITSVHKHLCMDWIVHWIGCVCDWQIFVPVSLLGFWWGRVGLISPVILPHSDINVVVIEMIDHENTVW